MHDLCTVLPKGNCLLYRNDVQIYRQRRELVDHLRQATLIGFVSWCKRNAVSICIAECVTFSWIHIYIRWSWSSTPALSNNTLDGQSLERVYCVADLGGRHSMEGNALRPPWLESASRLVIGSKCLLLGFPHLAERVKHASIRMLNGSIDWPLLLVDTPLRSCQNTPSSANAGGRWNPNHFWLSQSPSSHVPFTKFSWRSLPVWNDDSRADSAFKCSKCVCNEYRWINALLINYCTF